MTEILHSGNEFLRKITEIIEANLGDEQFGVPDLAEQASMSRSNLLRKVKKLTGHSVSVFIRKVRLFHAREMLKDESLTASEVSFKVGFSSASYFTKCFREEFGYTPGERHMADEAETSKSGEVERSFRSRKISWSLIIGLIFILVTAGYILSKKFSSNPDTNESGELIEKTIAVLPFKNDSNDTSNVYFVNGLMQTILSNLQHIEDLQVTSRTTVEQYRNSGKTIPQMATELGVNYFVEGSGQKVGDKILLTIQLIDGRVDRQIWSRQYENEITDIFNLQTEVARNIAAEVQASITPEEEKNISRVPTENLEAYDFYLKGLDLLGGETMETLTEAIVNFNKAIDEDPEFAHAYAYVAICYYYLDIFQADKKYGLEINTYADKASLYDSEIPESLIAKGLFYMQDDQYELAVQYLEKALTYSPNAVWVHNFLSDIYTSYIPNTEKYLSHALRGIRSAAAGQDSVNASFSYLHLSNALAQSGFIRAADIYVQESLDYNPENIYAEYLQIYIRLAKNYNLERAKNELVKTFQNDTTRLDIIQEIGKVCYYLEDYPEAWKYYTKYLNLIDRWNLDPNIYPGEDLKIAWTLTQLGREEEAKYYFDKFKSFADNEETIYKELILSSFYASRGNIEEGMKHLKAFSSESTFIYWVIMFLDRDPIITKMSGHSEYASTMKQIKDNFWAHHEDVQLMLEKEGIAEKHLMRLDK